MISLYEFGPAFGMPTTSPFGLKLEAYMRLSGIEYQRVYQGNPGKGPKGKIPYISDGDVTMGDSQLIIEHLKKTRGDSVDGHLGDGERARGHAIRRMVEEALYFINVYQRWLVDENFKVIEPAFFGFVPAPLRGLVAIIARRGTRKHMIGQGIARQTPAEVVALGEADVRALSTLLGDQPFFLGERPSSVDASVYGITHAMHKIPMRCPVSALIRATPNLAAFDQRMSDRLFAS